MKISVLISTYNRREALSRTIEALLAQAVPLKDLELLVADDCGTDGTYEYLLSRRAELLSRGFRSVRFFRNPGNRGIAYTRSMLIGEVPPDSEGVLFLDDDVYLRRDTLQAMSRYLEGNLQVGVVGPRIVFASTPGRTAHCANFVGKWSGRYSELDPSGSVECDWLNSSCFLVRRTVLGEVRFAEEFYIAHEEVDFCLQVGRAGYKLVYFPEVCAEHDLPQGGAGRRGRLYYLYRNKFLVFRRNFPLPRRISATAVALLFGLPLYLLESLRYNGGVNMKELSLIVGAVADGLSGRYGRRL